MFVVWPTYGLIPGILSVDLYHLRYCSSEVSSVYGTGPIVAVAPSASADSEALLAPPASVDERPLGPPPTHRARQCKHSTRAVEEWQIASELPPIEDLDGYSKV